MDNDGLPTKKMLHPNRLIAEITRPLGISVMNMNSRYTRESERK